MRFARSRVQRNESHRNDWKRMRFVPVDTARVGQAAGRLLQAEQSHIWGRWCVPIPYCGKVTPYAS
jgi:hypothetical protein